MALKTYTVTLKSLRPPAQKLDFYNKFGKLSVCFVTLLFMLEEHC